MSDSLIAFLSDRLLDEEGIARDAGGGAWTDDYYPPSLDDTGWAEVHPSVEVDLDGSGGCETRYAHHIALHDPARVLRAVAAKWEVLDLYERLYGATGCPHDTPLRKVLVSMAKEHSDHADYRKDGWR